MLTITGKRLIKNSNYFFLKCTKWLRNVSKFLHIIFMGRRGHFWTKMRPNYKYGFEADEAQKTNSWSWIAITFLPNFLQFCLRWLSKLFYLFQSQNLQLVHKCRVWFDPQCSSPVHAWSNRRMFLWGTTRRVLAWNMRDEPFTVT